jgi:hypothetical protein
VHAKAPRHSFEAKPALFQRDPREFPEAEAIEPALTAKAGKAWLASLLHPAKESLVGFVDALERGALHIDRKLRGLRIASAPLGELASLVEVGDRDSRFAVGSYALFERRVVELALGFEDALKGLVLGLSGQ